MAQRYEPRGLLALERGAFGIMLVDEYVAPETVVRDGVAIVTIRGPLAHHKDACADCYDDIRARVTAALVDRPRHLVLSIDSPGGVVAGCFALVRDLRAAAAEARVPVIAHVDGAAASAAYALACVAGRIVVTDASLVGSIGVLEPVVSTHRRDAGAGVDVEIVASGDRKADGQQPGPAPLSRAARTEIEARVDGAAQVFFECVAQSRPITVEDVRALEGRVLGGRDAVAARLADEVMTLEQLIASLAGARPVAGSDPYRTPAGRAADTRKDSPMNDDEVRAHYQAILDDEKSDEKAKALAKAVLAKYAAAASPKAENDAPPPKKDEEPKKDGEPSAAMAFAEVHKLRAEMAKDKETTERATLLASRPDFAPELVASLQKAPMEMVRDMVATLPRTVPALAASASVPVTVGKDQGAVLPRLSPQAKAQLDARMGIAPQSYGVVVNGREQLFGVPIPAAPPTAAPPTKTN